MSRRQQQKNTSSHWDAVAYWYDGWMGASGSQFHRELALPLALNLLSPKRDERILDIGCGQGVLAKHIRRTGAYYIGVDSSHILIKRATARHAAEHHARFIHTDVRVTDRYASKGPFDAAVFLLSVQDMDPLDGVFRAVTSVLRRTARVVIIMTHPCFRVPRMSGWGVDPKRNLVFRRVDGYITSRRIPIRLHGRRTAKTYSYHRPIQEYVEALRRHGFSIDAFVEKPIASEQLRKVSIRGPSRHNEDIPVLLGIRATRSG